MKKAKLFKNLILILMAAAILVLALFACTTDTDDNGDPTGTDAPTYTREQILGKLSTSLDTSVKKLADERKTGTVTTTSEYSIIVEDLKYTVKYNAAIDYSHVENSRIYFKIYDDECTMTRIMAYYDAGTLYYENNGRRQKVAGFGTSGIFPLFLSLIENFDMSYSLGTIADIVSGTALENLIRSDNLKLYGAGENRTNISIQGIELDTLKTVPNGMIADFFSSFGTAFDAIGTELLGTSISDLGMLRIRSLDANYVEFYSENDVFDQMYFDFSGYMETLSPFSIKGGFKTVTGFNAVEVEALDDEVRYRSAIDEIALKNGFSAEQKAAYLEKYRYHDFYLGKGSFAGTVSFPSMNVTYDATLDYTLNYNDNAQNLMIFKIKDGGLDAAAAYYLDGKLYIDAGTLYDVFNAGFGLSYFNLPKAVVADFDLSAFLARVIDVLDNVVRESNVDVSEETKSRILKILVSKIESNGPVIGITVDKELIDALNQISSNPVDAANVAAYLGSVLGVSQTFIDNILSASVFDSMALVLSFNLATGGFATELLFNGSTVVRCDFEAVSATTEIYETVKGASVSAKPMADGSIGLYVTLDGKTYYLSADDGAVVGSDGVRAGSYFLEQKRFGIDGAVYSFAAPDLIAQHDNSKVGIFSLVQKKLSVDGVTYRIEDGRVLYETLSGSFDGQSLAIGNARYFVRDGKIYATSDGTDVLGKVENGVVTLGQTEYFTEDGDLFRIAGSIRANGDLVSVSVGEGIYIVATGKVMRDRGIYRSDEGIITLDGVNYYVNDGKIYQTVDFATETGAIDAENSKITVNGVDYYFDEARKEVGQHVFGDVIYPEEAGFVASGELKVAGMQSQDISKLLGAFIGDSLGLNTPIVLNATDRLKFDVKVAFGTDGEDGVYIKLTLKTRAGTETVLVEIATVDGSSDTVLIDFRLLDIRFRSPSSEVVGAFRRFAGEGSIFGEEDILSALIAALAEASVGYDSNGIQFAFDYHAVSGEVAVDPLLKLIGISNLSANGTVKVNYSPDMEEWKAMNADEGSFIEPKLENFPTIVDNYESIYDAEWIEEISFLNPELDGLTLKIPYDPETVKVVTGKNTYTPRASLLGQVLTYTLMLRGGENATKVAVEVVGNAIVFDSYEENPVHEKIAVRYDDGTEGEVKYTIKGFSEDLITEAGMAAAPYTVVIGEGKIAETVFEGVRVSVRSRELVKQNPENTDGYGSHYQSTVIGSTSVDPYAYALNNNSGLDLPEALNLRFWEDVINDDGTTAKAVILDEFCFDWEFDGKIDVSGGTFYARVARMYKKDSDAVYKVPDLVYEINVMPKIFSYVQFGEESGSGVYTVDVFDSSTYSIPARSREGYRLAVYFADGHYRIVGSSAMGLPTDAMFDGYLDMTLNWKYPQATHFALTGYPNPLGGETAQNTAVLAVDGLSSQEITARILEPTRNVREAGTVSGVVENVISDGTVLRDIRSFRYDNVSFGDSDYITVNPYATEALPDTITLNIEDRVTGVITKFTYPVERWLTDGDVIKEQDGKYLLKYPATEESWFRAVAVVGNGRVTDQITVRIYNPDAEYAAVTFDGYGENVLETVADAYSPLKLPKGFRIRLYDGTVLSYGDGDGARAFEWKVDFGTERESDVPMLTDSEYNAFRAFIEGRSRVYDPVWLTKGYSFENRDYSVVFTAHVPSDVNGSLEQAVEFTVNVRSLKPRGVDDGAASYLNTGNINRYGSDSAELLSALTEGGMSVLPIKMYAPQNMSEITYFFKVDWADNAAFESFTDGLKAVDGGAEYALSGTIFRDVAEKDQTFDVSFRTRSNEVLDSASFYFRSLSTALSEMITSEYKIDGGKKTLTVNLLEPYALKLLKGGAFGYALPSEYFAFTLSNIYIVFGDGSTGSYITDAQTAIAAYSANGKTFDAAVYDFGGGNTESSETEFEIRISDGSCEDYLSVKIVATPDVATVFTTRVSVEPYNDNGTLKYTIENGYAAGCPMSNEYTVTYNNSGVVVYSIDWTINDPLTNNGLGLVYNASEGVWYLPIANIKESGGSSTLTGVLPDGTEVQRVVSVNPKNIGGTAYTAQAAEGGYSAVNGTVNLANMYQLFEIMTVSDGNRVIDVAKLPSVIEPRPTATFAGSTVFTVSWQTENYFSVAANGAINGEKTDDGRYLIAHADISGYNGESQRVYLYINVAETEGIAAIRADGYDFRLEGDAFHLYLDPYKDNGAGGYDWTVKLPTAATVDLFGGSTSYAFASGLVYKYGDITVEQAVIDYKTLIKLTGDVETAIDGDTAELTLVLPDGFGVGVTLEVIPRIIAEDGVEVPFTTSDGSTGYRAGAYFVDPYNSGTYDIPTTIRVCFTDGASLDLNVEWNIVGANSFTVDYRGGEYAFTATLGGVGVDIGDAQVINLDVTVLDRSLKEDFEASSDGMTARNTGGTLVIERRFEDYIGARVSDIFTHAFVPSDFAHPEFPEAGDMSLAYPVLKIFGAGGIEAGDDAIVNGMAAVEFSAALSAGTVKGQPAKVEITTDRLTLVDDFGDFAASDGDRLYFNPFSKDSLKTEFRLRFAAETYDPETGWTEAPDKLLTFYTEKSSVGDSERSRRLIYWDDDMSAALSGVAGFAYGNEAKLVGRVENTVNYIYLQVKNVRLDLGYGSKESGMEPFDYVIDPLTPELVYTAYAEGKINGEWYSLGNVVLTWKESELLSGISFTGEPRKTTGVYLDAGVKGLDAVPITVNVYYLDRTVKKAFTDESGFTNYTEGNLYKIYDDGIVNFGGMTIDPVAKFESGRYVYPSNITAEFAAEASGAPQSVITAAVEKYGLRLKLTDTLWGLNGKSVTLAGTGSSPINLALLSGTVTRGETAFVSQFMETANQSINPFVFKMSVLDRAITATSITHALDIHMAFDGSDGHPDYSIDPYNITLPKSVVVTFGSGNDTTKRTYTWQNEYGELWTFNDESLQKLQREEIINGAVLASDMFATAYFTVNSETFEVTFPIIARVIDVNGDWGSSEVVSDGMIPGGTIYVKAGTSAADTVSQLPKEIYYNFAPSADVTPDYSPVPLKFETVNFFRTGSYTLRAVMGKVSKEYNILFNVEVIDPKLYDIRTVTDAVGTVIDFNGYDFVLDTLPVSVNSSGNLMAGLEDDWLPEYIAASDGNYIRVSGISYSVSEMKAYLTCTYEFISASDGPRIAGRADGEKTRDFVFEVPLTLNSTDRLSGDAELSSDTVITELGQPILLSAMPVVLSDGREYSLFWDVAAGGVDTNVSGEYSVIGYLLDSFNSVREFRVKVVVAKRELFPSEFGVTGTTIDGRVEISFTGRRVDWQYRVPQNCIDENGDRYAPVPTFTYSADGGQSWTAIQPVAVGTYLMKMTVDDTNVFGEKTVTLRINKALINTDDISFADTTVVYNGMPQQPTVIGLPQSVGFSFRMTRRTESGDTVLHPEGAVNAYVYTATLIIEESDSYVFTGLNFRTVTFTVTRANPAYRAAASETYNGLDRHIYVEGMPEFFTGGMTVVYTYTNTATGAVTTNRIRNVGVYRYTIEIHGGINYYDNNLSGEYSITQAPLTVDVGNIEVPYLDEMLPLNSGVTVTGVVGDDATKVFGSVFGELTLSSPVRLDGYSAPGSYPIYASGLRNNNYRIEYIDDRGNDSGNYRYNIVLPEGTVDVATAAEAEGISAADMLRKLISEAKTGDLKLYLTAGEYGDVTLSDASVSLYLYGEYDGDGKLATVLDSMTVSGGTVNLYALSFKALEGIASVRLEGKAGSLMLDRVEFAAKTNASGACSVASGSVGVYAGQEFKGNVTAYRISVAYRFTGIYMAGGSLNVENSLFDGCVAGIEAQCKNVSIADSEFAHSTLHALYLTNAETTATISGNEFRYNVAAIKYNFRLSLSGSAEVINENVYFKNNENLISQ